MTTIAEIDRNIRVTKLEMRQAKLRYTNAKEKLQQLKEALDEVETSIPVPVIYYSYPWHQ